ncbi:MAG: serine/threonine-protein kinase [Nostocales cyanobacterium 94392]|nr:serine/threonine-protein kinase [Nostocales cyanobacterium 94392]
MLLNKRYRVIRSLGSGGFGETFLAEDTQIPSQRLCVIKQLKLIQHNPQTYELVKQRFAREAAILEALGDSSSQIPSLYAYFHEGQQFYLAQEYIQGQTLSEMVTTYGTLSESRVREILVSLLKLLEYVHSQGIVHRDIKPENIIIRSSDNQPVLIDFGAVRETMTAQVNSQGNVTSSIVIGTPGFMPMEQAAGRAVFASDLYSLGLVGIYLLTAKLPQQLPTDVHTGEIIWYNILPENPVSSNFAAVLEKVTRSHLRERFSTATEMLNALQPQATVQMIPPPQKIVKPTTQGNWFKSVLMGSAIGGCVLLAFVFIQETRQSQQLVTPIQPEPTATIEPINIPNSQATSNPIITNSFYFLADSAFREINNADNQITDLKNSGYQEAGKFWLQDYPNLSDNPFHQVYAATFNNRADCIESLKNYVQRNENAYCALASQDANASPNYFYGSQIKRPETDAKPSSTQAIIDYYTIINNRNYSSSWNQLSPKFQQHKSNNSYSEYVDWWNKVERVAVEQANTLSTTANTATVEVRMKYYLKSGRVVSDAQKFELVWNQTQQNWNFDDSTKLN